MKNLVTLFLIAMLSSFAFVGNINAEIEPTGRSASFDNTGAIQAGSVEKRFINVKNTNGAALSAGDVVAWDATEDDGYSIATTSTAGELAACVITEACAAGAACNNCQTWGLSSVNFDSSDGSAVAGQGVFLSVDNAGYAAASSSPSVTNFPFAVFLDAAASSTSVEVMIRL